MPENNDTAGLLRVAEAVRAACLDAARAGYEEARMQGLCPEGAWEAAVGAMQMVALGPLVAPAREAGGPAPTQTGDPDTNQPA